MLKDGYTAVPHGKIAAVVTYLEMRNRPVPQPFDPPVGFAVRRMHKPPLAWYRELFRAVGQNWLWFSRLRKSDEELTAIIHNDAVEVYSLERANQAKGLLELDRRETPDIEMTFFGVAPDVIGRGAGKLLMDFAIHQAWSYNPRRLHLTTCTLDHPRALPFYLKAGFTAYKRAVEVSDDPRLNGLLPASAAPQVPLIE